MKSNLFFIFALFILPKMVLAEPVYGLFMIVKGDVSFKNPQSAAVEKAKVGLKVYEGSTLISFKDSRAKIVMSDRNVINLSPDSKLTIQKYDSTAGKKNVSLSLEEGKARINVEQKYDGSKEKFLLKTPTVVAGVRGTQFLVAYDSQKKISQVVTFKGSVAMTSFNSTGQPISTVNVEKGQSSSAGENKAPEAPKTLPKDEIKELDKSTSSAGAEKKSETKSASSEKGGEKSGDKAGDKSADSKETKVTNSKDLDTDIAKDIKVAPTGDGPKTTPLPPPPPVVQPIVQPTSDFARDAIQNQNSKTKVNIIIQ